MYIENKLEDEMKEKHIYNSRGENKQDTILGKNLRSLHVLYKKTLGHY